MRDEFLTIPEVAEYLRVSEDTILRMLEDGRLQGVRIGGKKLLRVRSRELQNRLAGWAVRSRS